jgi:hypothetical protein
VPAGIRPSCSSSSTWPCSPSTGATVVGVVASASAPTTPRRRRAEFAVRLRGRSAPRARGIGTLLLEHLAARARRHGISELVGEVLPDNIACCASRCPGARPRPEVLPHTPGPGSTTASSTSAWTPPRRRGRRAGRRRRDRTAEQSLAARAARPRLGRGRGRRPPARRRRPRDPARAARLRLHRSPVRGQPQRRSIGGRRPRLPVGRKTCRRRSSCWSSPSRPTRSPACSPTAPGRRARRGRAQRRLRRGRPGRPAPPARPAADRPGARHPAGRPELPRRHQHRPPGPARRRLRPARAPGRRPRRRRPVRRGRHRPARGRQPAGHGISTFVSLGNKADVSGNDLIAYWYDDPATTPSRSTSNRSATPASSPVPSGPWAAASRSWPSRAAAPTPAGGPAPRTPPPPRPRPPPWTRCSRRPASSAPDTLGDLHGRRPDAHRPAPAGRQRASRSSATPAASTCWPPTPPRTGCRCLSAAVRRRPAAGTDNPVDLGAGATRRLRRRRRGGRDQRRGRHAAADRHRHPRQRPRRDPRRARPVVDEHPDLTVAAVLIGAAGHHPAAASAAHPSTTCPERAVTRARARRRVRRMAPAAPGTPARAARRRRRARPHRWSGALAEGGGWQPYDRTAEILAALRHHDPAGRDRAGPDAAAADAAERLGYPVVLKSADPAWCTRATPAASGSASQMRPPSGGVRGRWPRPAGHPGAGVLVQRQLTAPVELVAGLVHDPQFGSVVLLGLGGVQHRPARRPRPAARADDRPRRRPDVARPARRAAAHRLPRGAGRSTLPRSRTCCCAWAASPRTCPRSPNSTSTRSSPARTASSRWTPSCGSHRSAPNRTRRCAGCARQKTGDRGSQGPGQRQAESPAPTGTPTLHPTPSTELNRGIRSNPERTWTAMTAAAHRNPTATRPATATQPATAVRAPPRRPFRRPPATCSPVCASPSAGSSSGPSSTNCSDSAAPPPPRTPGSTAAAPPKASSAKPSADPSKASTTASPAPPGPTPCS